MASSRGFFEGESKPADGARDDLQAFLHVLPGGYVQAIEHLDMGNLEKVILRFDEPFWRERGASSTFLYIADTPGEFPGFADWTDAAGAPILICLYGGRSARDVLDRWGDREIAARAMRALRDIFGGDVPAPVATRVERTRSPVPFGDEMMNATHALSLMAALVLGWSLARAQSPGETEARDAAVGLEYLELYHAGKIEGLRPFFTAASVFEDPTAEAMGSGFRLTGGDEIVTQLAGIFAAQDPDYLPVFEFQSGRFAVSAGSFAYDIPGAMAGSAEESVRIELQVASIVEFDGQHVVRHADYGDYPAMTSRLNELKEQAK